jgi:hypothetical protein
MDTKRRKIQLELPFMAEGRGEAPMAEVMLSRKGEKEWV